MKALPFLEKHNGQVAHSDFWIPFLYRICDFEAKTLEESDRALLSSCALLAMANIASTGKGAVQILSSFEWKFIEERLNTWRVDAPEKKDYFTQIEEQLARLCYNLACNGSSFYG